MTKQFRGLFLPDREEYLINDIQVSPMFRGRGTIQFKKYAAAMPYIRNWRVGVDIGANLGLWTRVMSHMFEHVTCFEPNAECTESFWLNQDLPNSVTLYDVALGQSEGECRIDNTLRSTGFTHVTSDAAVGVAVPLKTLDSFKLADVDFIKIDVEGFEYDVVLGGAETINASKPTMLIEQKPNNAERFGRSQHAATKLLQKWGAEVMAVISGDVILRWKK